MLNYGFPPAEASRWPIFNPPAVRLGDVDVDDAFDLREIGDGSRCWAWLAIWKDGLDVEHVREYGLTKPEA